MGNSSTDGGAGFVGRIRRTILAIFLFGLLGSGTELLLLGHTEDVWQWVPLILTGVVLLVLGGFFLAGGAGMLRLLRLIMLLFILSGVTGSFLHYKGNVEFEREMYPAMTGLELFWNAIQGATPVLAPGTMIVLGLLGLVFTYKQTGSDLQNHKQQMEE